MLWTTELVGKGLSESVDALETALIVHDHVLDRELAIPTFLALRMRRPLEAEPGVGKTEVAKVLATIIDRELIRFAVCVR